MILLELKNKLVIMTVQVAFYKKKTKTWAP